MVEVGVLLRNTSFPEPGPPTRSIRRGFVISSFLSAMVAGSGAGGGAGCFGCRKVGSLAAGMENESRPPLHVTQAGLGLGF